ncbi:hypothetical protein [Myxococcus sp. CA040A]|uniref:hypothetical protein n=1 Tax=Myxococcus sp. CA040A TaxID=2741738 RepID=UPI00157B0338|nr:hypothetical protein [Myxococcus sp. CA040A]NTX03371.1 hypothetical protein [Myxococcus sp. CA040A]
MYCPDCRQERLGQFSQCALCGTAMTSRPRSELEAELAHVHFLLSELTRWDSSEVPSNVRRFLSERYERQSRILLSVLAESPAPLAGTGQRAARVEGVADAGEARTVVVAGTGEAAARASAMLHAASGEDAVRAGVTGSAASGDDAAHAGVMRHTDADVAHAGVKGFATSGEDAVRADVVRHTDGGVAHAGVKGLAASGDDAVQAGVMRHTDADVPHSGATGFAASGVDAVRAGVVRHTDADALHSGATGFAASGDDAARPGVMRHTDADVVQAGATGFAASGDDAARPGVVRHSDADVVQSGVTGLAASDVAQASAMRQAASDEAVAQVDGLHLAASALSDEELARADATPRATSDAVESSVASPRDAARLPSVVSRDAAAREAAAAASAARAASGASVVSGEEAARLLAASVEAARASRGDATSAPRNQASAAQQARPGAPNRVKPPTQREPGAEELPLPENPSQPSFEAPPPRNATARLVEETSTWNRVWRPFLYESIMWFVGAFLILSGTLYFVFESWAGMSSVTRSLTVFGMTVGYSAGFSVWGAYLARREALRNPGRILGIIGSASAPIAGIALGPMGFGDALLLGGVNTVMLIPLLLGWAVGAAFLVRKPADAFDAPSRPFVQVALVASTLMMGLAPLAAKLGGTALWLNILPCVLFFLLSARPVARPREGAELTFALGAPLYLLLVYAVRLHVALVDAGTPPDVRVYAPFLAFLLAAMQRFRSLPAERAADPLALGVASLQVMCLVAAIGAPPPTLFVTAAVTTWTLVSLARGAIGRLPWVYPAYAASYFAYATSGQLIPGPVKRLIAALKAALGYPDAGKLPLQYGALTAMPFILAGVVLAVSRLWRGERTGNARDLAFAEVLFRSTAVASVVFTVYGLAGPDTRPGFWSVLGLSLLCLVTGLLVERFYLTVVGALLSLLVPVLAADVLSVPAAAVVSGLLSLALAGVCTVCTARTRSLLAPIAGLIATAGLFMGLGSNFGFVAMTGAVLCAVSTLVVAWALRSEYAMAYAALLAAALVPKFAIQVSSTAMAFSLVFVALTLAVLAERGRLLRLLGGVAVFYALFGFVAGAVGQVSGLGLVVLLAAAAIAVVSRMFPLSRPLAVFIAAFALLPDISNFYAPWNGMMTPGMSLGLFLLWGLGASLCAARWGRGASTTVAGLVAWVFPLVAVVEARSSQGGMFLLGAAFVALLTARAMPAGLSVAVAALYATMGLYSEGPVVLLGLSAVLGLLAVAEEIPAVLAVGAGGKRFAWVATLASALVLAIVVVRWDDAHPAWMVSGAMLLPLLWTRATRQPVFASLAVPYAFVGFLAMGGTPPTWAYALPLVSLAVARAVAHVPAFSSLLLRSNEEKERDALSLWMQLALACLTPMVMMAPWMGPTPVYFLTASLALMPGPRPFMRVCGASLLLLVIPEARPVVTSMLLALALAEHHAPSAVWAFFRSPPDVYLRRASVITALAIAVLPVLDDPSPPRLAGLAAVVAASAFLLSRRWLLVPAVWVLALATAGRTEAYDFLEWRPETGLAVIAVALGAGLLSALCQSGAVQRALSAVALKLTPGLEGTWSEPLWVGSAGALALLLLGRLADAGPGALASHVAAGAVLTSLVLMVARERWMANVATVLLAASLVAAVPMLWLPAVISGAGLVLCVGGMVLDSRGVRVGAALHHGGWVLALLSLASLRDLEHLATPLCFLFGLASAWTVVWRRREREVVGWLASLAAAHGALMHLGAVYSSGRGSEFILPHFGAASAVLATLALFLAGAKLRRGVGLGFTVVALTEVLLGLSFLGATGDALREALVACIALAVLFVALVRHAAVEKDEPAAFLAQAVLALGYLSVRLLGMGTSPSTGDSLAALVGGALFTGLYFFVQREGSSLAVFRRPALWGAYLFPLAGLFSAPWGEPLQVAALLVGHAAHFAALASHPTRRGGASLASVVAFNVALYLVWQGTGQGEPQFYVIPAGLSLLALLRVFRGAIDEDTYARLRALAVTVIYVAGAWKPLMFSDGSAMLLCVFLCVVGVGFGIALRIRSYVYLGTAFLVTCIAANLVRFGMRDHRVAAASLFLLGLFVIGSMVMLSAHRAALLQRYARVRALLSTWEG